MPVEGHCGEQQIIQVFDNVVAQVGRDDFVHQSLYSLKCISEPKHHGHELI